MKRIYLDNAATSYPKAPGLGDAMKHFVDDIGDNVNRSGYDSLAADEMVFETREMVAALFNGSFAATFVAQVRKGLVERHNRTYFFAF